MPTVALVIKAATQSGAKTGGIKQMYLLNRD